MYYDRQGKPIDLEQWARLFVDHSYRFVAETVLPNGRWVATIWTGHDLMLIDDKKYIFETTVFAQKDSRGKVLLQIEHSSEGEALELHAELVTKWSEP